MALPFGDFRDSHLIISVGYADQVRFAVQLKSEMEIGWSWTKKGKIFLTLPFVKTYQQFWIFQPLIIIVIIVSAPNREVVGHIRRKQGT